MKRALPLLVAALCAQTALAQSTAIARPRFEIIAGANFANLSTPTGVEQDADTRTGLVAGIGLIKPLAPAWSFQPELTYSMKGAKSNTVAAKATVKFSYIEMPLLMRYDIQSKSAVQPFFQAGPALAFKTSCNIEAVTAEGNESGSCSDFDDSPKTFDMGFMFGGGLAFRQMEHTVSIGVRYNLGLLEIADGADSRHRVLAIVASFDWPWGK